MVAIANLLLVFILHTHAIGALTVEETTALQQAEAAYPECTLTCMAEAIPNSICTQTNITCLCTSKPLNTEIEHCMTSTCRLEDQLATKNVSSTLCQAPVRDRSNEMLAVGLIPAFAVAAALILRFAAALPMAQRRALWWDDYIIILTALVTVVPTVNAVLLVENGLGKDIWKLPLKKTENVLLYFWIGELTYFVTQSLNKLSLLLFLIRVFPDKAFRRRVYAAMALTVSYALTFFLATLLQCRPIDHAWLQLDESHEGSCNNIHLQGWLSAVFNIVVDVVIFVLPLRNLYGLHMPLRKKVLGTFMFSLGVFVTVISVVRLRALVVFANTRNPTYDYIEAAYWSTLELHLGIICASLPAIRILFVGFSAKILGSSNRSGNSNQYGESRSRRGGITPVMMSGNSAQARRAMTSITVAERDRDFVPLVHVEKGGHPEHRVDRDASRLEVRSPGWI